ncbi:hypothetical protein [Sulfuriroseicoccus oceanibius]|uniref:Uncharacterized protein n=1 Tax=Sulfuriroseicoccus oceanibius TaxID=2707525 RepID=A0A6B3LEK8_9BACT|nr:hypothetical protein [Sulfuriroseicoccus oceanibius]QQL44051.1 hypothetical protein G3M56_009110 [Sulfuriroseicoccus oceanibius]
MSVLRSFFDGMCDAPNLVKDLEGGVERTSHDVVSHYIDDLDTNFPVTTEHLMMICDAFTTGDLTAQMIQQIAFAMMADDYLEWNNETSDGQRVAEVIGWWDSPEINYPITESTITKFRHYLCTGENQFTREDLAPNLSRKG